MKMSRAIVVDEFKVGKRKCVVVKMIDKGRYVTSLGYWHNGYVQKHKRTKKRGWSYDKAMSECGEDLPEELTFEGKLGALLTDETEYWGFDTMHVGDNAETQKFETVRYRTIELAKYLIKKRI